jgi:signal transduction histidine kinase
MSLARARRFRQVAPTRGDLLLVVLLAVPVLGSLVARAHQDHHPLVVLLAVGALGSLLLRRDRANAALLLAVAVDAAMPDNHTLLFPVMAVLYTLASQRQWQSAATAGAAAACVVILAGAGWGNASITDHGGLLGYVIGVAASCAAAVALGLYVGARRRVLEGLRERAERLDREQELLADRAVAEERVRIAQELHDVVAHNVSLMVVQAQALGATVHDERVTQGTDAIADLGRQAMTEMHTTLRLLRADGAQNPELAPQPGLAQLERLLEQSRAAGLAIELTVEGQPRRLSQGVDLSAFRIVQEALTNVVKHARASTVRVSVGVADGEVVVEIQDDGAGFDASARTEGFGLAGMRERVSLAGGNLALESGERGTLLRAVLPVPRAGVSGRGLDADQAAS